MQHKKSPHYLALCASRLRLALGAKPPSRTALAIICQSDPKTLSYWLSGARLIPPERAALLAQAIPLNLHWLYTGQALPPPPPLHPQEYAALRSHWPGTEVAKPPLKENVSKQQ